MKTKKVIRFLAFSTVFGLAYLGVTITKDTELLAGEVVTVHSLTITNAKAECAEETGGSTGRSGKCNSSQRCAISTDQHDCSY
jgi:hypothetical protein